MDLQKAKEEFLKYTEKYDLTNERIKGKQLHSLRVMEISKQIAEGIGLSKGDVELAILIGLLHDIARFEQFTQYQTYKDLESFDHGDFGAQILQQDIRKYTENTENAESDEVIIKAVKNHNKFKIEDGLTEKEELFSKIIRDADKIDIFYQSVARFWKGKEQEVNNSVISEDVIQQIKNLSQTKRKLDETPIDNVMRVIAFIFDLNFKSSFKVLKEEDYINKCLNRYNLKDEYTKECVEKIRNVANEYINQKLA